MKFWNKDAEIDEIRMVESTKEHMFLYACRGKEKSYYVAFCEAYEDFPMSVMVYEVTDNSNEDKVLQIAQSLSVRQEWK